MRRELARVLVSEPPSPLVRQEIVDSWRQSVALGLVPGRFELPYDECLEQDSPLARAAKPVVDQLGADLAFTEISVVLSGERGRVVARRAPGPLEEAQLDQLTFSPGYFWDMAYAGTNGVSGAFANRSPLMVQGDEHFADVLTTMATAGAPIRDPRTAQVLGVLALVCSVGAANSLLLPMVSRAVYEVEQRLLDGSSILDRVVQERFLTPRRQTRGPLAAVSPRTLLTNAAAARMLAAADRPRLWDFASSNLSAADKIKQRSPWLMGGQSASLSRRYSMGVMLRVCCSASPRSTKPHPRSGRLAWQDRAVPRLGGTASPRPSTQ